MPGACSAAAMVVEVVVVVWLAWLPALARAAGISTCGS
jgi:hypothetical protein